MLLKSAEQAITATDLQKKTRELLDRIASGEEDHFVVMRDNRPAAVMMAAARFEAMMDELADLRIDAVARARMATPRADYLARKDIDAFLESL